MQRITINKLGPINYLSVDINRYNFFIGEQATGKSTIAKAIYFCRNYKNVLKEALNELYDTGTYREIIIYSSDQLIRKVRNKIKSLFVDFFGYSWDVDREMLIKYDFVPQKIWLRIDIKKPKYAENTKRIKNTMQYLNLKHSDILLEKISILVNEVIDLYKNKYIDTDVLNLNSREYRRIRTLISDKVNEVFDDYEETYYIPAGRSMLSLLSRGDLLLTSKSLDYVTYQFVNLINSIRNYFTLGIPNISHFIDIENEQIYTDVAKIIMDILKADYHVLLDREYISVKNENKENRIPLNFASSGQQECLWLLNLLYVLLLRRERCFIIIEEPEAHMYPTQQYKILKFISYFSNKTGSNVLITTHSPYFLTALNTLYVAGKSIVNDNSVLKKKIENIIGGNYFVDENSLQAYKIQSQNLESLIDVDEKELKTEMIDDVSKDIIDDYMKIYELISEVYENEEY